MRVAGTDFSLKSSLRNLSAQKDAPGRCWTRLCCTPAMGSAPQGQLPTPCCPPGCKGMPWGSQEMTGARYKGNPGQYGSPKPSCFLLLVTSLQALRSQEGFICTPPPSLICSSSKFTSFKKLVFFKGTRQETDC